MSGWIKDWTWNVGSTIALIMLLIVYPIMFIVIEIIGVK